MFNVQSEFTVVATFVRELEISTKKKWKEMKFNINDYFCAIT